MFDYVHRDQKELLECFYSKKVLTKKEREILPFNKEHCLPKYFLKKSNFSYDNNLLLQVPILVDFNSIRANRPYFCPFETEEQECRCDEQALLKNRDQLQKLVKTFPFGSLMESYYNKLIDSSSLEVFGNKLPQAHELFVRNEAGNFYLGDPGFFCPRNHKGALARACLYALLKYKSFRRERMHNVHLEYLVMLCKKYPVEEWEVRKNFFGQYLQQD